MKAGNQPSASPSRFGGDPRRSERGGHEGVVEEGVESSEEAQLQHHSHLLGRAEQGEPDAGLPLRWPWLPSLQNVEVDGDPLHPGSQVESAVLKEPCCC